MQTCSQPLLNVDANAKSRLKPESCVGKPGSPYPDRAAPMCPSGSTKTITTLKGRKCNAEYEKWHLSLFRVKTSLVLSFVKLSRDCGSYIGAKRELTNEAHSGG